ncbi:SusC/RagA family TonB-linked outer membrane protein [Maribacter luteus]|uniref:SusC/RagA family TonB-linked outer membrane protein n=1 Tax=Maribacter luteus TaxID=2594478 RepID=UPI0024916791|nr:TonB-dependent receptor [Maribacter luteus]
MKSKILFLTLFLVTAFTFGQSTNVSGTVSDSGNMPIPGVNVIVKNTTKGTATDFDGVFALNDVPINSTLVFSYLGFQSQEVIVTRDNQTINVTLTEDAEALEEVVVIGYGTQKVSKISGAVSTVKRENLEKLNAIRADDALQGQASGVNVIGAGSPGSKPTVLIRGIPSYTGTDPLVVIDGVTQSLDDLNSLNTSDIESINVLKDAALSAIYGVKGGNGVIVVKTKSGKRNTKTTFSLNSSYGLQQVINKIDVLNASQYAAILNEASANAGEGIIFSDISGYGKGTDWQEEVFKTAPITTHNLSASGGSDITSYFVSIGYMSQEGIVGGGDKSYFDRVNLTGNFDTDLSEKLKLISNTSYSNIKGSSIAENSITGVLSNALNMDPTVPVYDEDGNFGVSETITQEIVNPVALIDNTYNKSNTNKLTGKLELQYDLLDNLKFTSRFGYTYVDVYSKNFYPLVYYGTGHNSTTANADLSAITTIDDGNETDLYSNRVSESRTNYFNFTYEMFANYNFNIGDDHAFETVLGMAIGKNTGDNITASAEDIPFNSWNYADVSASTDSESDTSSSWQYETRNISYFTRINYDFMNRYLLSFTGRIDGSTNFGKNNKFGFFPSASLGWLVSEEEFFNPGVVTYFKLRGSYGTVGNDNIDTQYSTISTFPSYTFGDEIASGSTLETIPNEDVSWENQIQYNIGFDTRLFDNKLSITADYFNKTVDDLLFDPTLSLYLGSPEYPTTNIGKTSSYGIDASIGYNSEFGDNLKLSTNVSFTTSVNEVKEINNGNKYLPGSGYGIPYTTITRFEEGYSPGYFFGYKTNGIFQNQSEIDAHATQDGAVPGDIRFVDVNGDGEIDDDDRTEIGDPFPDFTVGWNLALDYKNFDFNVFTYASVGNDIYRAYERNLNYTNRFASVLDRWTGEGTSYSEPRVTFSDDNNNTRASDRYIEDGSFIKIKNIQLGYKLPEEVVKKNGFDQIRIYGQVKNAFVFTDYSGYDPEISNGDDSVLDTGVDRGTYPQPRVWTLGINVKF